MIEGHSFFPVTKKYQSHIFVNSDCPVSKMEGVSLETYVFFFIVLVFHYILRIHKINDPVNAT